MGERGPRDPSVALASLNSLRPYAGIPTRASPGYVDPFSGVQVVTTATPYDLIVPFHAVEAIRLTITSKDVIAHVSPNAFNAVKTRRYLGRCS